MSGRAVVLEIVPSVERLVAEVTLVRPLPGVVAHVPVSIWAGSEAFLAVLTQVSLVALHAVALQLAEASKQLIADITGVGTNASGLSFRVNSVRIAFLESIKWSLSSLLLYF
jgi:hypothetical protein